MAGLTTDSKWRSPFWICCYTSATGQRLKKSTKVAVKPLPGERRKDGKPKTTSDERAEAQDFCRALEIAEIVERTSGETFHNHTVADWLTEWQAGKADPKAKTTAGRYAQVVREFLEAWANARSFPWPHITSKDIRAYRDDAVRIVSTAFNAALLQGYITNNACTALETLPEETAERSTFTTKQVADLVSKATGDWKGAILFAFYTGARLGDLANMTWRAIDLDKRLAGCSPSSAS